MLRRQAGWVAGSILLSLAVLSAGRLWAGETAKLPDEEVFKRALTYKFGEDARDLNAIADFVLRSYGDPQTRKEIEQRLVGLLRAPEATYECKQFACRQLVEAGTAECVPALAALLPDPKLSHMGLYALARIQGEEASKALRDAFPTLQGELLIGVINAIGYRRDAQAVPALLKYLDGGNPDIVAAAAGALGKIGGEAATQALAAKRTGASGRLRTIVDNAYLQCADLLLAEGKKAEAEAIYERLNVPAEKEHIRAAALRGLIAAGGDQAIAIVMKPFSSDDVALQAIAASYIRDILGTEATKAFAAYLPKLTPDQQVLILDALADRGDAAAGSAAMEAAKGANEKVRVAALRALARVGDAAAVPLLAQAAAGTVPAEADAARYSLTLVHGPKVDDAILDCMQAPDAKVRVELIKSLTARRTTSALPALLKAAQDPEGAVRQEAFKALGSLADEKTLPGLVELLLKAKEEKELEALQKAVLTVAGKAKNEEERANVLLGALPNAGAPAKAALLHVLARFGGDKPLAAARAALQDPEPQVRDAALRSLAEWPDAGPAEMLLEITKTATDEKQRILALRGYVRALTLPSDRPISDVLKRFEDAMTLAKRPDEKKSVLSAISDVYHPDALKLLEPYLADPALKAEAEAAAKKIKDGMNAPPKATASVNVEKAAAALDNDPKSRWDTGAPQAGGEWFQLELPMEREICKITLDSTQSAGDYPRGYEVYISRDGKNWGPAVAKGEGKQPVVEIALKPTYGRFLKIVQTGKAEGLFWSIHELKLEAK